MSKEIDPTAARSQRDVPETETRIDCPSSNDLRRLAV
ncbi:hypothetical protein BV98_002744 [Sphingobium herbicidovorans NBRC 16415]|uniref:Uncharacterized protein n=1 Tax=Sphingobium herbicidovorans (strain ATCC 700291 / DSM 11019 / CCUG 56400 / KCTC 2939 / LMG 18315 / NBRC 16415 / MH) TaxID=1219045 RepID=A0A086P7W2_SPHHM|nr:hypothetical protein BV98_002744 [Sphingobium herbicidovorans NBRC 16415]